jgi:hypothetical protein
MIWKIAAASTNQTSSSKSVKSMSDTIHIEYIWSRENNQKLFEASYRYMCEHSARRYVGWVFIILLQFGIVAMFKNGTSGLLMFSSLALIYWYVGRKWLLWRRAMKSWQNSPFRDQTVTIEAGPNGLSVHTLQSTMHLPWEDINTIRSLGDDILLLQEPHLYYIPASGFASLEDKSAFKTMAAKHGKLIK